MDKGHCYRTSDTNREKSCHGQCTNTGWLLRLGVCRRAAGPQIVIGHPQKNRWEEFVRGSTVHRLLRLCRNADIPIVAEESLPPTARTQKPYSQTVEHRSAPVEQDVA